MDEKGGEVSELAPQKAQLREETLAKLLAFQDQSEDKDLYDLVKNFFKRYLNLPYEFTITELRTELKKIYLSEATRQQLDQLLDYISPVEFLSEENPAPDTRHQLDTFRQIVEALIPPEPNDVIRTIWQKINFMQFYHAFRARFSHQPVSIDQIELLISQVQQDLQNKAFESASQTYQKLMTFYNTLEEPEKTKYYERINELYTALSAPHEATF